MQFLCDHCRSILEIPNGQVLDSVTCKTCRRPTLIDEHARQLGHFLLIEKLGAGAYGTVWKGQDLSGDRMVAIKVAKQPPGAHQVSTHLLREVRLASQLDHLHIASVYEAGRQDEWQYIVSEFVEGRTLAEWLKDNPLSVERATDLCISLATALQHAHESGVVHRDLKPSNIVMDSDDQPCIIDFGASKCATDEVTMKMERYQQVLFHFRQKIVGHSRRQGPIVGTPQYMSPEQAMGNALFVDHRCDIYSLGVVYYEMLTGKRAFRGSPESVLRQVMYIEPPRPRRVRRGIPVDMEAICLKSMAKDAAERYRSAKEMADDCRRTLSGEPISAARPKWFRRACQQFRGSVAMWRSRSI